MNSKWKQWLQGRYGVDEYSRFLNILALIFVVPGLFFRQTLGLFPYIGLALVLYSLWRTFSRNIAARQREYYRYSAKKKMLKDKWLEIAGTKEHRYFRCPSCHAQLRVPKGKGKVRVRCPKCGHEMTKRT